MVADVLEEVLVQHLRGWERAEAARHEEPAALPVLVVVILPSLVGQLAEDFVAQLLVLKPLVDDVVREDLLPRSAEVVVVHEPEDQLEDGEGLLVVRLLALAQERCLDRLALHLPQVRLEVDVGHLCGSLGRINAIAQKRTI